MPTFYIVRLGKDSEPAIRAIDKEHGKLATPLEITLSCKQVPAALSAGDFLFVGLAPTIIKELQLIGSRGSVRLASLCLGKEVLSLMTPRALFFHFRWPCQVL